MINRTVLVGRLTRDPELRYTPSGVAVASFTIACDRPFTNQQGEREADFIRCVIWHRPAENVANYLKKGSLAGVEGRIQTRSYDDNDGKRVFITEVVADRVQFLEPRSSRNSGQGPGEPYGGGNQNDSPFGDDPFANDGKPIDISDDDLPF
ncbi:MAG TPA: single-stranded DNA-binding protein [Bacillales bacterium]|nr:single-stranded DNA-binding protein [Bacillales bacterium]